MNKIHHSSFKFTHLTALYMSSRFFGVLLFCITQYAVQLIDFKDYTSVFWLFDDKYCSFT
ncbi:MAG: hypothetical protein SFU25_02440 [Candidatus Caenarcaniphilales bacterium]|nr:hypothetical protein [Candidatus Caenarcaniphilales bacterium]